MPWIQVPQGEQSTPGEIPLGGEEQESTGAILSKEEELTTANAEFKLLNTHLQQ